MSESREQLERSNDFHWTLMDGERDVSAFAKHILKVFSKQSYKRGGAKKIDVFSERVMLHGMRKNLLPDLVGGENETVFVLKNSGGQIEGTIRLEFRKNTKGETTVFVDLLSISARLRGFSRGRSYFDELARSLNWICNKRQVKKMFFDADFRTDVMKFYGSFATVLGTKKNTKLAQFMLELDPLSTTPFTDAIRKGLKERRDVLKALKKAASTPIHE